MTKRRAIISSVLTLLLVFVAAWAFGFFNRTDPAIAELQQIGSQMWDKNLPDAQRNQLRTDFRQRMESMTDEQRRAFFDANRNQWAGHRSSGWTNTLRCRRLTSKSDSMRLSTAWYRPKIRSRRTRAARVAGAG